MIKYIILAMSGGVGVGSVTGQHKVHVRSLHQTKRGS